jgi:O-antigen/teichoic acid export membrane protein
VARIGNNLAANLLGKGMYAALNFAFPPIYAKILGVEAYGLVGLYTSIIAILAVLDLGLSTTLNREMARLSTTPEGAANMTATVRTFELIFWGVGLVAGSSIIALAPFIAGHWVRSQQVPVGTVITAIRMTGVVFALQWPGGLYSGGLVGLERQVAANMITASCSTIRLGGAALVLWLYSRSIEGFFAWQALAFALQTIATRVVLSRCLPPTTASPRFSLSILLEHWRLSAGISITGILSMGLSNADKIIVSKLLPLKDLGYYTLAWTLGTALYVFIGPVFLSVFPRLSQLVQRGDEAGVTRLYHLAAQAMAVLVLPAACAITFFSREVVLAWTGDATMADEMRAVAAIVTVGTALNGLMNVPFALQLAYGWTRLGAWTNFVALLFFIPLVYLLTVHFGRTGAAAGWAILNAGYVAVGVRLQHRRLLRGELWTWYRGDNAAPLMGALLAVVPIRLLLSPATGRAAALLWVATAGAAAYLGAALAAPRIRAISIETFLRVVRPSS